MKKILLFLFASSMMLTACSGDNQSKSEGCCGCGPKTPSQNCRCGG